MFMPRPALIELEATAEHETVLDLVVLERLEDVAPAEPRETPPRIRRSSGDGPRSPVSALIQAGLVLEPAGRLGSRRQSGARGLGAGARRMRQRDRMPLTFAEVEQELGNPSGRRGRPGE
jgi:hypothetical protein